MPKLSLATFRALRHRNYRLFFIGQGVSLIGTWITNIATSWLVYRLSGSSFLLGLVSFMSMAPAFLLSPLAGVKVDQWDRHRTLLVTQFLAMLQSLTLAALTLTGHISVPILLVLMALQGVINAFDFPARQAFVSEIVSSPEDLVNAIALNSGMFNAARLIGPSIGGVLIALSSEGMCFLIDGVSYGAVLIALACMKITSRANGEKRRQSVITGFREALGYAFSFRPIGALIILVAGVCFCATPATTLLPVLIAETFHGGADTLGVLMASIGLGSFLAAVYLASRQGPQGLGEVIGVAGCILSASLVGLSAAPSIALALVCGFGVGVGNVSVLASCNTLIQILSDPMKRGRVLSFFIMAVTGMVPAASLAGGWISHYIGANRTIFIGGVLCLGVFTWFISELPGLRRIAQERGRSFRQTD